MFEESEIEKIVIRKKERPTYKDEKLDVNFIKETIKKNKDKKLEQDFVTLLESIIERLILKNEFLNIGDIDSIYYKKLIERLGKDEEKLRELIREIIQK